MKRLTPGLALAIVASFALTLGAACSDDDVEENDNQESEEDVMIIEDTGDLDADDDGEVDVEGDDADTGPESDVEDDADADELPPEFDVDPVECSYPITDPECEAAPFGPASFFKDFHIETQGEEDACCFDINGDQFIDNYIGEDLVAAVGQGNIPGFDDVNQNILASIQSGELTYLMESYDWRHPEWEANMDMRVYLGGSTQDSMDDNLAGEGSFNLSPDNFDEFGEPKFGFENVEVRDGQMSAEDGFIEVQFPGLVEAIAIQLGGVQMTADVVQDPEPDLTGGGDFSLVNGKLGGAILRDKFFRSMNEESLNCDCLELDDVDTTQPNLWEDGLYTYDEGSGEWDGDEFVYDEDGSPGQWVCDWKAGGGDACEDPSEPVECQTLGNQTLCSLLSGLSDQTDVWIDGEPSFSIGVHFETVPTDIIAVDPD